MKEVFIIRVYGTDVCFFKNIDNNTKANFTQRFDYATKFADYSSAELYLKSNSEVFSKYKALQIEKYFVSTVV